MAHPGGRPTKYDPAFIKEIDVYLKMRKDKISKHGVIIVDLPTIEDFATHLDVNKTTLYEWRKEHTEFSNSLDKILAEQQKRLLNMGLSGHYNSTIAKLILSNNHNMKDQTENTIKASQEDRDMINGALYGFINHGNS